MEPEAAKLIGAGLATIALAGAGIGIGTIFGNYLSGALRNPSAAPGQFPNLLLGFALAEATGLHTWPTKSYLSPWHQPTNSFLTEAWMGRVYSPPP